MSWDFFPSCGEAFSSASHNQKQQLVTQVTKGQSCSLYETDLSSNLLNLTLLVPRSMHPHSGKTARSPHGVYLCRTVGSGAEG